MIHPLFVMEYMNHSTSSPIKKKFLPLLIEHHVSAWEDTIRATKNNGDTEGRLQVINLEEYKDKIVT